MVGVPVAFTFGLGAWMILLVGRTGASLGPILVQKAAWIVPSLTALGLVVSFVLASGCRELADRLDGPARTGAQAARGGFLVKALLSISTPFLVHFAGEKMHAAFLVQNYAWFVTALVISLGLARAARASARDHVAAVVLSTLGFPPPLLDKLLAFDGAALFLSHAFVVAWIGTVGLLARKLARETDPPIDSAHEASLGLLAMGGALSLRLEVAGIALVVTLLALLAKSVGLIELVSVGAPAATALSVLLFGLACLRVSRADRNEQTAFLVAGAASIWVFSISVAQSVWLYAATRDNFDGGLWARQFESLMLPLSVVGILTVVIALGAASTRARRFGAMDQSRRATHASYAYIGLTLTVLAMTTWGLPKVQSMSGFLLATIAIAALGVMSLISPIKAFNAIGAETEGSPLPVATAVES